MKALFDTNVLVAAFVPTHPFHPRANPLFRRACMHEFDWAVSQHSLAETFHVLTGMPSTPKVLAADAIRLFESNIYPNAEIVSLDGNDYKAVLRRLESLGLFGGIVFDALIAHAAQKVAADRLYTFNPAHFLRAWPEGASVIAEP